MTNDITHSECGHKAAIFHCIFVAQLPCIQNVQGGKVNIVGGHSTGHSKQKKKKVYMYMCPIRNGF
jgi:hypothetical protein